MKPLLLSSLKSLSLKNILCILVLLVCTKQSIYATHRADSLEHPKMEVAIGGGLQGVLQRVERSKWSEGPVYVNDEQERPVLYVQYLYNVSRYVGLGALMSFTYSHQELLYSYSCHSSYTDGSNRWVSYLSFCPTARFYWFNRKHIGMYSKIGAGITFLIGEEFNVYPDGYLAPVCVEVGGRHWRGFTELPCIGLNYPLLANVGLMYRF